MAARPVPHGVAERPRAEAVDDHDLVEAGQRRVVEVAVEGRKRLVHPRPAEVERRGDRARPVQLEGRDPAAAVRPVVGARTA